MPDQKTVDAVGPTSPKPARGWFAFWKANVSKSYKTATDTTSLVSFVGGIIAPILGVVGVSALTTSKVLTTLGAGLGLLVWFLFLMLFVTPARLWREAQTSNQDPRATFDLAIEALAARNEELRKQLRETTPRDIPWEKRGRIARHIRENKPTVGGHERFWDVTIHPLSNAPDAAHLAKAVSDTLRGDYHPTIDADSPVTLAYSMEELSGIVLLYPTVKTYAKEEENRQASAQLIIDAFATEGIEIERRFTPYLTETITVLIGGRA